MSNGQPDIKKETVDVDDSGVSLADEGRSPDHILNAQTSTNHLAAVDTSPLVNVTTDNENHSPAIPASNGVESTTCSSANVSSEGHSDSSQIDASRMQQAEDTVQDQRQGIHHPHPIQYFTATTERLASPVQVSAVSGASSIPHATSVISAIGQVRISAAYTQPSGTFRLIPRTSTPQQRHSPFIRPLAAWTSARIRCPH